PRASASLIIPSTAVRSGRGTRSTIVQMGLVTGMPWCLVTSRRVRLERRCTLIPGRRGKEVAGRLSHDPARGVRLGRGGGGARALLRGHLRRRVLVWRRGRFVVYGRHPPPAGPLGRRYVVAS